jgi:Site-specific recombinase XerD
MAVSKQKNKAGEVIGYRAEVKVKGSRATKLCKTYSAAKKFEADTRKKRIEGLEIDHGPITIEKLWDKYGVYSDSRSLRKGTVRTNQSRFNRYLKKFFRGQDMREVQVEVIEAFLNWLTAENQIRGLPKPPHLSNASANRVRSLLGTLYNISIRKRYWGGAITFNPVVGTETKSEKGRRFRYWSLAEKERFYALNSKSHDLPLWIIMLELGLRVGEACALRRRNFDLENDLLTIDEQWSEATRAYIPPKTEAGKRVIYLADERINFKAIKEIVYPKLPEDPAAFVFIKAKDGSALKSSNVLHNLLPAAIGKCVDEKGDLTVKDLSPHDLRRTFGVQYMMNGGSLWRLHEILGHENFETTQRHYAKFSISDARRQRKVLERNGNVVAANFEKAHK